MDKGVREIRPGRYRHYKGNYYEVIGLARHSEIEEEYVVYRCLYGDFSLWVRPLAMFLENVTVDGREIPRFACSPPCGDFEENPGNPESKPQAEKEREGGR